MFLGWIYQYLVLAIISLILLGYNIYCFIGLFKLGRTVHKNEIDSKDSIKSKGNIYIWFIKKALDKNKKPKETKLKFRVKLAKRINIGAISLFLGMLIINVALIMAIYLLNIQATNIANILTTIFGNEDCICYAKCTGNEEDDSKTAYELLFGKDEYDKLVHSLSLSPHVMQEFTDIKAKGDNGKAEGEWLIAHLDDNAVQCYKDIVGNNNKFRSGDHKDRSKMTNGELRDDLIALLSDYKIGGINPNCECCKNKTSTVLKTKCLGEAHYVEGWTWEAIWDSDNNTTNQPSMAPTTPVGTSNAENSAYGINLGSDGWFYWYQQVNCSCAHNVNHPTYGQYGSVILVSNTAVARGCSSYASSMAISNACGAEITPYTLLIDIMGGNIVKNGNDKWEYDNGGAAYINYKHVTSDGSILVSMNRKNLAARVEDWCQSNGYTGVHTKYMSSLTQAEVDDILAKGGYIVASWKHGMPWYHPNDTNSGSHFMVIRKKDSSGNYYCLDSAVGDSKAVERMTTPATWDQVSSRLNHPDGWGIWNEAPSGGGTSGGGIVAQPGQITDADIQSDISNGLYTEEDYNYLVALGGESSSYEGFYAVACSVRNRVQQDGNSYKNVVTAKNQYAGYNPSEVGNPRNDDVKNAAIAVLRGGPSTVGNCRNFFGRINRYDIWAEPTITEFYNIGGNIFYGKFGEMHNQKPNKTSGAITVWGSTESKWYYPPGTSYHK